MKTKLILTTLLLVICLFAKAQLLITSDSNESSYFDEEKDDWEIVSKAKEVVLFGLDNDMTTFVMSKGNDNDFCEILDWSYDEETVLYEMVVKDQNNLEFYVLIDGMNLVLSIFYEDSEILLRILHNISDVEHKAD